jgi:hypothetical protein
MEERAMKEHVVMGADHGLHIIWELCESQEMAVSLVGSSNILPLVLDCLRPELPPNVVAAAAQCFLTVSEDNIAATQLVASCPDFLPRAAALLAFPARAVPPCVAGMPTRFPGAIQHHPTFHCMW